MILVQLPFLSDRNLAKKHEDRMEKVRDAQPYGNARIAAVICILGARVHKEPTKIKHLQRQCELPNKTKTVRGSRQVISFKNYAWILSTVITGGTAIGNRMRIGNRKNR